MKVKDWERALFHPAHLLESTISCLKDVKPVEIPSHEQSLSNLNGASFQCTKPDGTISTWDGIVFPPPKYKSFDSLSMKRIKSSGEGGVSTARKSITRNREGVRNTKETVVICTPYYETISFSHVTVS